MHKPGNNRGVKRLYWATRYSLQGLKATFKHEEAFRIELVGLLILAPIAVWLGDTALEVGLMIAALLLVMLVEIINSAIESIVDRMGSEHHELAGRAKDQGSAAVMVAMIIAALVWGVAILH